MANSTIPNLVAVTVPALTDLFGVRQSGDLRDKKLTAAQLISLVPGGGDVSKVGTPANNQIGVWTGDGTIEGDANFLLTGTQLTLPTGSSAGLPELKIGSGQTGFFSSASTQLRITAGGVERFTITSNNFQGFLSGSPRMINRVSSLTVPTVVPNTNDDDTGIGGAGTDILALIAGGVQVAQAKEVVGANQFTVAPGVVQDNAALPSLAFGDGDSGFYESADDTIKVTVLGVAHFYWVSNQFRSETAFGPALVDEAVSGTNPTLCPKNSTLSTGIGSSSSDVLSLIANASERVRISSTINTFTGNWVSTTSSGPGVLDEGASSTNPTLVPNQADPDTGLGRDTVDGLAFIAGGVSCMRIREIAAAPAVGFYTTTPIVQQTGVAVTAGAIHAALVALGLITA